MAILEGPPQTVVVDHSHSWLPPAGQVIQQRGQNKEGDEWGSVPEEEGQNEVGTGGSDLHQYPISLFLLLFLTSDLCQQSS